VAWLARLNRPEIMDDFSIKGPVIEQTLREIERINQLLGGNSITLSGLRSILARKGDAIDDLTVADLGCGGGEMSLLMLGLAKRVIRDVRIVGFDANEHIVEFCQDRFADSTSLEFETANVLSDQFASRKFDIITATLFIHHFTDEQLTRMLRQWMKQVNLGIVINDLHRHPFAYHSIKILTRLFSKSSMVKYDAPLSVQRAFTKKELVRLMENAGIEHYKIKWKWAFRWQIVIMK
jgi:2-polyprenyl-3-methyl-5-hydroxy-6-metoxy-1,4-benzoquinol methylase